MPVLDLAKILDKPHLPGFLDQVNSCLETIAKTAGDPLSKPLIQVVKAKSKRLRPALLMASAIGSNTSQGLILGGSSIELLHLGSLVHDDIIDNASSRWGKPTISFSDGQANALLAGDFLLAQAGLISAQISPEAPAIIGETISDLARGESSELAENYNLKRSVDSYIQCCSLKTGALISAACRLGGVCANLAPEQINALGIYGKNLGISFQIIDDLLDILSTSRLMGKPVGADASQGTYTLPVILSMHGPKPNELKTILSRKDLKHDKLANILLNDGSIERSLSLAKEHNNLALAALSVFKASSVSGLVSLPSSYLGWSLGNLVKPIYRPSIAGSL